jgi:LPXTG-site transpeptidase (sortase) family protein
VRLSRINNIILLLIILLDGYVVIAPFAPSIIFSVESHGPRRQQLQKLVSNPDKQGSGSANVNEPNSLVIPAILVDQPILEGSIKNQYSILNQGIWRWPEGSTPDKAGNTTLIGHRFTYTIPKGVFYFLNKLNLGNEVAVFWNHEEYIYKVSSISTVSPNDTAIEANTAKPELTLFTCTPLWLPKDRLVVQSSLERVIK